MSQEILTGVVGVVVVTAVIAVIVAGCRKGGDEGGSPEERAVQVTHDELSESGDPMRREALLKRINVNGPVNDPKTLRPLVTLEAFFEGNHDPSSIGYNLPHADDPQAFFRVFREIRNRDDVVDVRVQILDLPDADGWPATDTVWIITSASREVVMSWFPEGIAPDEIVEMRPDLASATEPYEIRDGMQMLGAWWD